MISGQLPRITRAVGGSCRRGRAQRKLLIKTIEAEMHLAVRCKSKSKSEVKQDVEGASLSRASVL